MPGEGRSRWIWWIIFRLSLDGALRFIRAAVLCVLAWLKIIIDVTCTASRTQANTYECPVRRDHAPCWHSCYTPSGERSCAAWRHPSVAGGAAPRRGAMGCGAN